MISSLTDCHCHILPLLDDGATCMYESVLLAKYLVQWGFKKVVCTSHRVGKYPNVPDDVKRTCAALQEELIKQDVPLELTPSMEYRLIPETWPETLEKGYLLPWEGNHILIELPIHKASRIGDIVPEDEIRRLLDMGYRLIPNDIYIWIWTGITALKRPACYSNGISAPWKVCMVKPLAYGPMH